MATLLKDNGSLLFHCEGCGFAHAVNIEEDTRPKWKWNGDMEKPTFTPSVLVTYPPGFGNDAVCHSFVKDGKIKYLSDCTHKLAGQTVELTEI